MVVQGQPLKFVSYLGYQYDPQYSMVQEIIRKMQVVSGISEYPPLGKKAVLTSSITNPQFI